MKNLIERNYESTRNRGLINENTSDPEFIDKIKEELSELEDSVYNNDSNWRYELADIILVCLNYGYHYGFDMENILLTKIKYNENRNG